LLLGDWLQLWLHSLSSKGYTAFLFLLLSRFEFEIQDLIVIMQKTSSNAKFWSTQRILFPVNFFFQIKNIKLSSRHKSLVDQVDYNELKEMNNFFLDSRKSHSLESALCGSKWGSKIPAVPDSYKSCTPLLELETCCADLKSFTITLHPLKMNTPSSSSWKKRRRKKKWNPKFISHD